MAIHHYEKRLERLLQIIDKEASIHPRNKQILLDFKTDLDLGKVTRQVSTGRIYKYIWMLRIFLNVVSKPLDEFTNKDLDSLVASINNNQKWKATTKYDMKVSLKIIVRWLNKNYFPKKKQLDISWLKPDKTRLTKLPEELITPEEVDKLISACTNRRDRAFIAVLYESGGRVGEILEMSVKHCTFDEYGAILYLSGKTGTRTVRIIEYAELLRGYIEQHPYMDNPEHYFWLGYEGTGILGKERFLYMGVMLLLKRAKRLAGLNKRVHPHLFRHSRATLDSKVFTEHQLSMKYGWKLGSNMPATYVSLSQRDMDEAYLKQHGIAKKEKIIQHTATISCAKCSETNSKYDKFCKSCRMPLDLMEKDNKQNATQEAIFELLTVLAQQNPQIKETFKEIVKKKGLEDLLK